MPNEPHEPVRVIVVDPRRTVTINACEVEAGKDRVMHLAINSGTDLALFNAWLTYIAEKGWVDKAFIEASTKDFDKAVAGNRTSLEEAARITGLTVDQIRQSAEWIAQPKAGGARRRTMFAYEKGLIWGNDNYRTNGALVNVALATGNIGRPGGGCVRLGGHQEGYSRPSDAHVGRPAAYVDQLLINGKGGVHHIWGCDHYKTTLNALKFKQAYKKRTDLVKDAMSAVPWGDRPRHGRGDHGRDPQGRAVLGRRRHHPDPDRAGEPHLAAGRDVGRDEPDLDERRAPHAADRALHGPARAGDAGLPDRRADRQQPGAGLPRHGQGRRRRPLQGLRLEDRGRRLHGRLPPAREGRRVRHLRAAARHGHERLPGAGGRPRGRPGRHRQLAGRDDHGAAARHGGAGSGHRGRARQGARAAGHRGVGGGPAPTGGSERIIGTKRLYADGKFNTKDGKAVFMETQWRGLQAAGKQAEKDKFAFLINNGRTNHVWQSAYLDQENDLVMDRWPFPFIEMNPQDMAELNLKPGDLVEVYNDNGSTQAMAYPTERAKPKQTFMLFAYPMGVQGNVVSAGVNEFIIPNYKQTWGNIRKIADAPEAVRGLSFKSKEYSTS